MSSTKPANNIKVTLEQIVEQGKSILDVYGSARIPEPNKRAIIKSRAMALQAMIRAYDPTKSTLYAVLLDRIHLYLNEATILINLQNGNFAKTLSDLELKMAMAESERLTKKANEVSNMLGQPWSNKALNTLDLNNLTLSFNNKQIGSPRPAATPTFIKLFQEAKKTPVSASLTGGFAKRTRRFRKH